MYTKDYVFQESKQFTGAGTEYTKWLRITDFHDLLAFIKLTAQGTFTAGETLTVSAQTKTPGGDAVDLVDDGGDVAFTEIGDKTASLPFLDYIGLTNFGAEIRFKIVTAGTSPDYTFGLTGIGKDRA